MKFTALNVFRLAFVLVAFVALVSAGAVRPRDGPKPSPSRAKPGPSPRPKTPKKPVCKPGPIQCCQTVVSVDSKTAKKVLSALQIWVDPSADYDVGLSCVAVDTLKHKESDCNANLVCCEDDNHGGVIDLKCTPAETD